MVASAWVTAGIYQQNEFPLLEYYGQPAHLSLIDNLGKADI